MCVCLLGGMFGCGGGGDNSSSSSNVNEEKREMTNHAVYDGVAFPDSLWTTVPEVINDEDNDRHDSGIKGEIKAIYYRSDYNEQESYAFAFLGIPEGASTENKKPAVLLVHGGGGTAYWQWVKEWVNRGYVALAMDLEGHVPKKTGTSDNMPQDLYDSSEYTAPHNTNYGDAEKQIETTWMYYATSTAIRGNTLLHSLDYVNKYKIGVCGVSWGGVITSIITGYDDRFAFSIPIYCSLNIAESNGNLASYYKNHYAARVWDDDEGLSRVNTPVLILAMNNDPNASADSLSATAERCKNGTLALVRDWAHSHSHAFIRQEPYSFADKTIGGGDGLIEILNQPKDTSGSIDIKIPSGITATAYLVVTDGDLTRVPSWVKKRLSIAEGKINYELNSDILDLLDTGVAKYFYISVEDNIGRTVSTNLIKVK